MEGREGYRRKNAYEVLGLTPEATKKEISSTFQTLASEFHPSVQGGGNEQRFKEINAAYQEIKTEEKRAAYNRRYGFTQEPQPEPDTSPTDQGRLEPLLRAFVTYKEEINKIYGKGSPEAKKYIDIMHRRMLELISKTNVK